MKKTVSKPQPNSPRLTPSQSKPIMQRSDDFLMRYVPAYAASTRTARVDMADYFRQFER